MTCPLSSRVTAIYSEHIFSKNKSSKSFRGLLFAYCLISSYSCLQKSGNDSLHGIEPFHPVITVRRIYIYLFRFSARKAFYFALSEIRSDARYEDLYSRFLFQARSISARILRMLFQLFIRHDKMLLSSISGHLWYFYYTIECLFIQGKEHILIEKYLSHLCTYLLFKTQQISTPPSIFLIAFGWSTDNPCISHIYCS